MRKHRWMLAAAITLTTAMLLPAQKVDSAESLLQAATKKELVDGNLAAAIEGYKKTLAAAKGNRGVAAKALLRLGECYEKQGNAEAQRSYERLVREFGDQKEQAHDAQARLTAMGQTPGGSKGMVAQLIAKASDLEAGKGVSPDGKICGMQDDDTGDVAVRDLQTGAVRRLTHEGRTNGRPRGSEVVSRNGKQIAYAWLRKSGEMELRVINVDGSGMRSVPGKLNSDDTYRVQDWSPDGKRLLVQLNIHEPYWYGLATVDVTTGEIHRLSRVAPNFDAAEFSPDGRWIVYGRRVAWDSSDWDIFAMDAQTGKEHAVVTGAGEDRAPRWVPNSDRILFRSDRNGRNALWSVRFQDGQSVGAPVLIKPDIGDYWPIGFSRDGSLYYGLWYDNSDVYHAMVDPQTLRLTDAPARLVETNLGHNYTPSWSPSGDSFAYYSEREAGKNALIIHQLDGKETVAAEPARWSSFLPHWCGNERVLSNGTPSPLQLRLFDARTGLGSPPDIQVPYPGTPYQFGFSPDCKSVYVSNYTTTTKQRRIYRYDVSTGKSTDLLTDGGEWAVNLAVSPDGRWLAMRGKLDGGNDRGILLLSTAGGPLRMLDPQGQGRPSWTPDSKRVIYPRDAKNSRSGGWNSELFWISVDGGTPQSMGFSPADYSALSLNADGRRALFSTYQSSNELWVLRNLPLNPAQDAQAKPSAGKFSAPQLISKGRSRDLSGRITPDGTLFPFVDGNSGDIAVRDLRTGAVRQLTAEGTWGKSGQSGAESPVPSRDGKLLAYAWYTGDLLSELRVMNIDGSGPRTVPVKSLQRAVPWDWAPDGKSVVAFLQERELGWEGMATVDVSTGETHRLLTCGGSPISQSCMSLDVLEVAGFSPDGLWIVYSKQVPVNYLGSAKRSMYALDIKSGKETELALGAGDIRQPVWVPGSDKILFRSDRNGKSGIWTVRFQSGWTAGSPVLLRHDAGDYMAKGVSRDGSLVYGVSRPVEDVYQAAVDPQTLRVTDTPRRAVDTHQGRNSKPIYSPTGDSLAYYSRVGDADDPTPWRMVIRTPDGKETVTKQSVTPATQQQLPEWCKAGGSIYFYPQSGIPERYDALTGVTSAGTMQVQTLQPTNGYGGRTFTLDCKSIYFPRVLGLNRRSIIKTEIATGEKSKLLVDTGDFVPMTYVSPDGRWLAFKGNLPGRPFGLVVIPTDGGPARMLDEYSAERRGTGNTTGITWSPDSKRLLYGKPVKRGEDIELFWIPVEGGTPQSMGIRMTGATSPSLHPDGKRILFSALEDVEELWVLRNLPLN